MGIRMNLFVAVICILHVTAKPFADSSACRIREKYECGVEPCACELDSNKRSKWMNFLDVIIPGFSKKCVCKKLCDKIVEVRCVKGKCDQKEMKCKCLPCWTGTSCSTYENMNKPMFSTTFKKINAVNKAPNTDVVGYVKATDADTNVCGGASECPCGTIKYNLVDGGDDTFAVDTQNGNIVMRAQPYKDDYLLVIGASNLGDKKADAAIIYTQINARGFNVDRSLRAHSRSRRALSSGSLVLTMRPRIQTQFYFNIGDQLTFRITLSHNSSVSAVTASNIKIYITSEYLTLTTAGISKSTGGLTTAENVVGDTFQVSITTPFDSGKVYDANVTATVKNTIGPLSNLKLTAELNATTDIHLKQTSSPVVYAVYPKINLTRLDSGDVSTYGSANFSMKIEFPMLNYSLLTELTTNIEDFIFMQFQNVRVANKGASISYNGTAVPKYYSTNNDGKNDRVVIDFGYLRNNANTQNTLEVLFTVNVLDHVSLVNNTKHWVGVGSQAGTRVLWVEQQSLNIIKDEPSLEVSISALNFTNTTRLYIGENLPVQYTIKHTNTSTASAVGIVVTCLYENLATIASEITANKYAVMNSTSVKVKPSGNDINNLNLGSTLTGTFNLQLTDTVTPFVATKVKLIVNYKNALNFVKDPIQKELSPAVLAGTPSILMSVNSTNNYMKPGEKRKFIVKVLLRKMKCPIRFELVMPLIGNKSVYHIVSVKNAVIGANVLGLNTSAEPVLKSTMNDGVNNQAIYDLGTGINKNQSSLNDGADLITLEFDVMLLDHQNVTNGSNHWVGAGLVGKPKMIWVGQIIMQALIPDDDRPWLYLGPSIIPGTPGSKQFPDYEYNVVLKHKASSTQRASDVKIRFFLPNFVQFVNMVSGESPRLTQKQFGGSRFFEISKPLFFLDTFNFTFKVQIDATKFPREGKLFITTPIYLLYKNRLGLEFSLVKVLRKSITVPSTDSIPKVTPVSEYYDKGFSWYESSASSYILYICSDSKAQRMLSACYVSSDKGATWKAVDSRVASINGHDSSGNIFGIAKNKRAYMKYDVNIKAWVSIPKSDFTPQASKFQKLNTNSHGDPPSHKLIAGDHWGVSKDGVFVKPGGTGSWSQKSIWL